MLELEILVWPKPEQPDRFLRPCPVAGYRTVCSVGTRFTVTASLMHQLMCTHSPVTVCCVVVCGSPRAEGLTVAPVGRNVVDMVSFLADRLMH